MHANLERTFFHKKVFYDKKGEKECLFDIFELVFLKKYDKAFLFFRASAELSPQQYIAVTYGEEYIPYTSSNGIVANNID